MKIKRPTIYGWGVVDVNYNVSKFEEMPKVNGKRVQRQIWACPYYLKWSAMIVRCFSKKHKERHPTYTDCTICDEWRYLSNFIKWVNSQPNRDWMNCELDKDLLITGNKEYSPDTSVFIPEYLNTFIICKTMSVNNYMLGVSYTPQQNKKNQYMSQCRSPFLKNRGYIGYFPTELEAHKAWQAKKHEYACQLADLQEDERVAKALRERYAPDKDWTKR